MKQIGIDQVKQLGSQLENLNSAIDANDNSIIELNTAIETNSNSIVELNTAVEETNNSIIELNNVLEGKQDTLIAGTGITIENNVISLNGGSSKSALQVTCSYNDDVLKGVAVVVDETTITTKNNGLATFTGLDNGTKSIVASKDGYATITSSKVVENPFETADVEMNPITLTFNVKNAADEPISGATVSLDKKVVTNDTTHSGTIYNAFTPESGSSVYTTDDSITSSSVLYSYDNIALTPLNPQPEFTVQTPSLINASVVGTLTNDNGVYSGFTTNNYISYSNFNPDTNPFEIFLKFKPITLNDSFRLLCSNSSGVRGFVIGSNGSKIRLWMTTNGGSWNLVEGVLGSTILDTSIWYWMKFIYDGQYYTLYLSTTGEFNGEEIEEIKIEGSSLYYSGSPFKFGTHQSSANFYLDLKVTYIIQNNITTNFYETRNGITINNTFYNKTLSNNLVEYKSETLSAITNSQGIAVINAITDGKYDYSVLKQLYETMYGQIIINRANETEPVMMYTAPINCYAVDAVTMDDPVKLNAGMGSADVDYNVYAANTSVINVLTLDGLARSSASVGETAEVRVTDYQEQVITITTDQDNADIEFNNGNDINQATINLNPITVKQKYLAFVKTDNSVIYFKGSVVPFSAGGNAVNNTQFTYYTYDNGVMTSHSATTSIIGNSNYQDNILTIYSVTETVNGIFTRTPENDVITEISEDLTDAIITTSSYLTTPEAVIPRNNYWNFAVEKIDQTQWKMFFIVGGSYLDLPNLRQIVVPNNTLVQIWGIRADKVSSPQVTQYMYYRTFTITNDRTFRKIKFFITDFYQQNFDVVIKINNVPFEFTGACNIEAYAGDVINWTVSKSGYVTQTGSYTVPDYPLPTSNYVQIQDVILIENTVTLTITDGTNNLSGATVIIGENTYTSDNTGKIIISNMNDGIYSYTASLSGYPTVTGKFTVAGANLAQTIALAQCEVTFTVTDSSSTPLENVLIDLNGNSYRTDSNGQVTVSNVDYGVQNYTAFLNGYAKKTGDTVNVNAATITKTVTLVANYNN